MKLEGSLDAFGLPDVLHLLHATAKTGALHLARQRSGAVVHLVDGAVVSGITADAGHLALLRRLVGQGLVDEEMVATAATAAAETGEGLVATLVSCDLIGAEIAQAQMHQLIVDTLFEVLRWDDGDFSFAAEELPTDDVGVRQPPGVVVEEATLRLPAWEAAADHVPSPRHVPGLCRIQAHDVAVSAEDWSLLALIDGRRSVEDIVAESGLGSFAVVVRLADLCERGCIELHAHQEAAGARQAARRDILAMLDAAEGLETLSEAESTIDPARSADTDDGAQDEHNDTSTRSQGGATPAPLPSAGGNTVVSVPMDEAAPSARSNPQVPAAPSARMADSEGLLLGGAHHPGDVVPPRPEPFLPSRQPEHPEGLGLAGGDPDHGAMQVQVVGANAVVATPSRHDESMSGAEGLPLNRSMVLRLIAGVRGL